jgi:uncharacterized protein YbaP (TraB family)
MHVRDARAFNFTDSLIPAIKKCEAFALELHPDTMMRDVFNGFFGEDSTKKVKTLKDLLSASDYDHINEAFKEEYGYSIDKLKMSNPYIIRSMLRKGKKKADDKVTFLDAYLLSVSKTFNKKIYGLEKTQDQFDFFNSFSKKEIRDEFLDILEPAKQETDLRNSLVEIYSRGDLDEIEKEVATYKFNDSIMIRRNHVMATSMNALMKKQSLFTAVGVAHLPGKDGVIQLLRNMGYKVTPVEVSFTGVSKNFVPDYSKIEWTRYADSANAISFQSPGFFINASALTGIETKLYFDLTNSLSYGYYVINMSSSEKPVDEKQLVNMIIKNYKSSEKYNVGKIKHLHKYGVSVKEISLRTGSDSHMRLRMFMKNNIFYGMFVAGDVKQLNSKNADKFLESFESLPVKTKKDPKWISFSDQKGAFSVDMPFKPKAIDKEVDGQGDDNYMLKIYLCTDMSALTNYIIRYNDYPPQMYIDKKEKIFDAYIADISQANTLLSGPDTVWKDGYEGRAFTVLLQGKYYTEGRIYVRGNRTYLLLKQNIKQDEKQLKNDEFFNSFVFEPYQETQLYTLAPEGKNIEVSLPAKPKVSRDTVNEYTSSVLNSVDYYSSNPNSGGLYQFEHSEVRDYFRVKDLSSYYEKFLKTLVQYNDSLVSSDSVMINGFYGREFVISNQNGDSPRRCRVWLAGNSLYYMAAYTAKDELFNEQSNKIFNSFKFTRSPAVVDYQGSKTNAIVSGLSSTDTSVFKAARGAFNYYEFDKTDLKLLLAALEKSYPDDTLRHGTKISIIEGLAEIKDTAAYPLLVKQFNATTSNDNIRVGILNALTSINVEKGLPVYLKLITSSKILHPHTYNTWKMFSPLRDSLLLTKQYFRSVLPLFDSAGYRNSLISLAHSIAEEDSTGQFLRTYLPALMKHQAEDLSRYIVGLKDTSSNKSYPNIYSYLGLLQLSDDKSVSDAFTKTLIETADVESYIKTRALCTRIKQHLPLDKKLLDKELASLESRYDVLLAYEEINEFNKVNSKYTSVEELGRLSLYNYIIDDNDGPDKIKTLGKVTVGDKTYFVYTFSFEGDKEEYIGIGGLADPKKQVSLANTFGITSFAALEKNWKEQATKLAQEHNEN